MIRGLSTWSRSFALAVAWTVMDDGLAQPGYAQKVKTECARAGRSTPGFSDNDCSICHQNAANHLAYQSGNYLDVLCELGAPPPVDPVQNNPPFLDRLVSPQNLVVGQSYSLTITAIDPEDDKLTLSAQRLPPGAKLKRLGKLNGKWTAMLVWKPKKKQANKTFTIRLRAKETKRRPRLKAMQDVSFFVAEAISLVQRLDISQSRYAAGTLSVSGRVHLPVWASNTNHVELSLATPNGVFLGSAYPDVRGFWRFALPVEQSTLPCQVDVLMAGLVIAKAPVKPDSQACNHQGR